MKNLRLLGMAAVGLWVMGRFATQLQAAPPSSDYVLLYEDDFSGNAVNEKDWNYRIGRRTGGGYINGLNRKENVSVSQGALHIAVRQETINGKLENTGGGLISKHQFGYGYYESLSKPFMAGRGVHSSFWQAGGAKPNNSIFEIDSYEIDSGEHVGCNNLYIHLVPKGYTEVPWPCRAQVPFTTQKDGWFLDAYEFTPEGVIFYDNGKRVASVDWPELTAAQAVWLTALNGCGKVDAGKLPGETAFKYFRYYTKDYPGVNLLPNGSFEYNQDRVPLDKPVSWRQEGVAGAGRVVHGEASRDRYKLRHGKAGEPYKVTTKQSLEYLLNGEYELSAMVRSSGGQNVAKMRVDDFGGEELSVDIPAGNAWTKITIPRVPVTNHNVTVAFTSDASAEQWLEVDDVRFLKPAQPGQKTPATRPFCLIGDAIWRIGQREAIDFPGNEKFYFFDRNVGLGKAMTVCFIMNPREMGNASPLGRMPKTGDSGWAVQLTESGGIVFRIGSIAKHHDVIAPDAYKANEPCRVVCVFDRGAARIYVNGKLLKSESGIAQKTDDKTAPGRMGNTGVAFDAVSDVIVRTDSSPGTKPAKGRKKANRYRGTLQDVRVYNRALGEQEFREAIGVQPAGGSGGGLPVGGLCHPEKAQNRRAQCALCVSPPDAVSHGHPK